MTDKNKNFDIIPIFNQPAKGVWTDFVNVETTCSREMFNLHVSEGYVHNCLLDYARNLGQWKHNFAFAAYLEEKMVGFIQGFAFEKFSEFYSVYSKETFLEHLYILPKYHKCGIGSRLLNAFEETAGLVSSKVVLTPLRDAVKFYEKNGYKYFGDMEKNLVPCANKVVPVFQWIKTDFDVKLNVTVNNHFLQKNRYKPVFVYLNENSEIDGVIIKTDTENKMWLNQQQEKSNLRLCRCKLAQSLDKVK